ncbi:MAG TPA: hypothetical protein EYQ02_03350, partial [Microbacterium sp.]|nr:hypothetical protein [Microbacterium sp.]
MSTPLDDLRGSSLLAVFAHPDDESLACGGLLAWCAERGVQVSLLCLTRGEHGPGGHKEHSTQLCDVRERELKNAARVLGIHDVALLDHEDGMLPWIDGGRLEADILSAVRRFQPEVVVTFDRDGLYWHPDHIAVHERTTAVIAGLGSPGPALRYVSIPAGTMRAVVDAASQHGNCGDSSPRPILGVPDADAHPHRHSLWKSGRSPDGSWPRSDATARSSRGVRSSASMNATRRGFSEPSTTEARKSARRMRFSSIVSAPWSHVPERRLSRRAEHMHLSLLDILRCPFCGTAVSIVENDALSHDSDRIDVGVLGCECCALGIPLCSGIPCSAKTCSLTFWTPAGA